MNAAKMTLTATILAAVFGLALSFGASPAQAHCRGKHLEGDTCTHTDEGQRSQTFDVELIEGDLITGDCIGSSSRKQVTDGKFPPSTVTAYGGLTLNTVPILHLCQVNINHPNRPDMSLTMFFTSGVGVEGGALCPDDVYKGEFAAAFDPSHEECFGTDATCVTIDQSGLRLEKLLQPDKGTLAVGFFSVGTIVWTPVP